jgi:hypothetical protein
MVTTTMGTATVKIMMTTTNGDDDGGNFDQFGYLEVRVLQDVGFRLRDDQGTVALLLNNDVQPVVCEGGGILVRQ